jgi:hypothetical protein
MKKVGIELCFFKKPFLKKDIIEIYIYNSKTKIMKLMKLKK